MVSRNYLFFASLLFAVVFLVQVLILVSGWTLRIENFTVPKTISVLGALVTGLFSYKSFVYWHKG